MFDVAFLIYFIIGYVMPPPFVDPNLSSEEYTKKREQIQVIFVSNTSILSTRSNHGNNFPKNKSSKPSRARRNFLGRAFFTAPGTNCVGPAL